MIKKLKSLDIAAEALLADLDRESANNASVSSHSNKKTKVKAADKLQISTEEGADIQALPSFAISQEIGSANEPGNTELELESGNTESKVTKTKKILPPVPERTKEELRAIAAKYRQNCRFENRNSKDLAPKTIRLAPKKLVEIMTEQLQTCTGRVSDNLSIERCQDRAFLNYGTIKRLYQNISKFVLTNPDSTVSIWKILADESLSIGQKVVKLNELGWVSLEYKDRPTRKDCFLTLYLLSQLMDSLVAANQIDSPQTTN